MARRYWLGELPAAAGVDCTLPAELSHHLAHVMRAQRGERIVLFDGAGREVTCEVLEVGRQRVVARAAETPIESPREPAVEVSVAFCPPRGPRSEWLFEHGCEVGIRRFHPLVTARSRGERGDDERLHKRVARWERILRAAAGQCDRGFVPTVDEPMALADFAARTDLPAERYVADTSSDDTARLGTAQSPRALLLVGPEGGLTVDELTMLRERGFAPVSLGPLTLRAETAVVVGGYRLLG